MYFPNFNLQIRMIVIMDLYDDKRRENICESSVETILNRPSVLQYAGCRNFSYTFKFNFGSIETGSF